MELRTIFPIQPSESKIKYSDRVVFLGSCFASSIGKKFELGRIPVLINPFGTIYNPVSVCNTLDSITRGRNYTIDDLYKNNNRWISFDHYTDFSSDDAKTLLEKINSGVNEARAFLSGACCLFITFGTARVYRWKESGKIVSNCHKIPQSCFSSELLTVSEIAGLWSEQLEKLHALNSDLKVVFTVSPVRHWKDGAHGNQVSKSVLLLAIEEILKHPLRPGYFPAYELVLDDLRDYRFYDIDMLHPSSVAVDYIWEAFTQCYFDDSTFILYREVLNITKAVSHRIRSESQGQITAFAEKMLGRIDSVKKRHPDINLEVESEYFRNLLR
jgi:hypothetical protein